MQLLYKNAGIRIRELRKLRGMSRDDLSAKCHVTTKFLYEIETGKKGFSAATLYDISNALGVCCDYILTGEKLGEYNINQLSNIQLFEVEDMEYLNDIIRLLFMIKNNRKI